VTLVNIWLFGHAFAGIVKVGIVLAIGAMLTYTFDNSSDVMYVNVRKKKI
jgi:hypothetical protein